MVRDQQGARRCVQNQVFQASGAQYRWSEVFPSITGANASIERRDVVRSRWSFSFSSRSFPTYHGATGGMRGAQESLPAGDVNLDMQRGYHSRAGGILAPERGLFLFGGLAFAVQLFFQATCHSLPVDGFFQGRLELPTELFHLWDRLHHDRGTSSTPYDAPFPWGVPRGVPERRLIWAPRGRGRLQAWTAWRCRGRIRCGRDR